MKKILLHIFLITMIIQNLYAIDKNYEFESFYGLTKDSDALAKFHDGKISLNSWLSNTSLLYNGKVEVKFYNSTKLLFNDYKFNKLDIIAVNLPFFFKHQEEIKKYSSKIWTIKMSDRLHHQYYLVSKKKNNLKGFSDLKYKTLSIKKIDKSSHLWLEKNSLSSNNKSSSKLLKKINKERKESTVLLNVFFEKNDYGIITKQTWDVMTELNPVIKKELNILSKSKKIFLPFIGVISKKAEKRDIDTFYNLSKELKKLLKNRNFEELSVYDSLVNLNNESLDTLNTYYKDFFILEKNYKYH